MSFNIRCRRTCSGRHWHRAWRWVAVLVIASICAPGLGWTKTASPNFQALQSGTASAFGNTSVVLVRVYLHFALATFERACPGGGGEIPRPWNVLAYTTQPPPAGDPATMLVLGTSWNAQAMETRHWSEMGEYDVLAMIDRSGCNAAAHANWLTNAKAFMNDPNVAGLFPQAAMLCQESGSSAQLCSCFATGYDMEATPAQRRRVLTASPQIEGLRATLRDQDFATRVVYKCATAPAIAHPNAEYISNSDEGHRLREGDYLQFHPLARAQDRRACRVTRVSNWRYTLSCLVTGVGVLSQTGDVLTVSYKHQTRRDVFSVHENGTLRLRSDNPRIAFDLLPPDGVASSELQQAQGERAGGALPPSGATGGRPPEAPAPRRPMATQGQCASWEEHLARMQSRRVTPTPAMQVLETRIREHCAR